MGMVTLQPPGEPPPHDGGAQAPRPNGGPFRVGQGGHDDGQGHGQRRPREDGGKAAQHGGQHAAAAQGGARGVPVLTLVLATAGADHHGAEQGNHPEVQDKPKQVAARGQGQIAPAGRLSGQEQAAAADHARRLGCLAQKAQGGEQGDDKDRAAQGGGEGGAGIRQEDERNRRQAQRNGKVQPPASGNAAPCASQIDTKPRPGHGLQRRPSGRRMAEHPHHRRQQAKRCHGSFKNMARGSGGRRGYGGGPLKDGGGWRQSYTTPRRRTPFS